MHRNPHCIVCVLITKRTITENVKGGVCISGNMFTYSKTLLCFLKMYALLYGFK